MPATEQEIVALISKVASRVRDDNGTLHDVGVEKFESELLAELGKLCALPCPAVADDADAKRSADWLRLLANGWGANCWDDDVVLGNLREAATRLESLSAVEEENRRLTKLVANIDDILHAAPELNMRNYTEDQVDELNQAAIEVVLLLRANSVPSPRGTEKGAGDDR